MPDSILYRSEKFIEGFPPAQKTYLVIFSTLAKLGEGAWGGMPRSGTNSARTRAWHRNSDGNKKRSSSSDGGICVVFSVGKWWSLAIQSIRDLDLSPTSWRSPTTFERVTFSPFQKGHELNHLEARSSFFDFSRGFSFRTPSFFEVPWLMGAKVVQFFHATLSPGCS